MADSPTATKYCLTLICPPTVGVLLTTDALEQLRELLQRDFAGTGVRYWATLLAFDGEFA